MEVVLVLNYLFLPSAIILLCTMIKKLITHAIYGRNKQRIQQQAPTLSKVIKRYVSFTRKEDKRKFGPVQSRIIYWSINLLGLILTVVAILLKAYMFAFLCFIIRYLAVAYSIGSSYKILRKRDEMTARMLSLKSEKMGLCSSKGSPSEEFIIKEWDEDLVSPNRILMFLPTRFDSLGCDAFMASFNLIFGGKRNWVPDKSDKDIPGWDFQAGKAMFVQNPPLPNRADWHEEYILNPAIAHSFFPIGLGAENGVKITNRVNGKEEFVLGIDFAGQEEAAAKAAGALLGPEITTSPMLLIAGGTGGGKALSLETLVTRHIV